MKKGEKGFFQKAKEKVKEVVENNPLKTATGVGTTVIWTAASAPALNSLWALPVLLGVNATLVAGTAATLYGTYKLAQKGYEYFNPQQKPVASSSSSSSSEEEQSVSRKKRKRSEEVIKRKKQRSEEEVIVEEDFGLKDSDMNQIPAEEELVSPPPPVQEPVQQPIIKEEKALPSLSPEAALVSQRPIQKPVVTIKGRIQAAVQHVQALENELGKDHFVFYRRFDKLVERAPENKKCALLYLEYETLKTLKDEMQGDRDSLDSVVLKNKCLREAEDIIKPRK